MEHLAIINRRLAKYEDILCGDKTIESRWYKNKIAPWDRIKIGDAIYFKETGKSAQVKATVSNVIQIENNGDKKLTVLIEKYRGRGYINLKSGTREILDWAKDKRYIIFIFFNNVEKVEPFEINKTGFGISSAWITTDSINKLKK